MHTSNENKNDIGEDIYDDLPRKEQVPYMKMLNMIKLIRERVPAHKDSIMD